MATPNPDNAGLPGHCCLCGRRDARCLCKGCRDAWTVDGVLAAQVRELQNDARRETDRLLSAKVRFGRLGEDW